MTRTILLALLLTVAARSDAADAPDSAAVASVRARHAKRTATTLKLVEPVILVSAARYKDGGTRTVHLRDAKGRELKACTNGMLLRGDSIEKYSSFLYVGASYPTEDGAVAAESCGDEARDLYAILLRWSAAHPESALAPRQLHPTFGSEGRYSWETAHEFLRALEENVARCPEIRE